VKAIFDRWYPRLVAYLHARVGDRDHAEDLAQEAFVRLLENRPRDPGPWLFTVAANLLRDEGRLARGRARRLALVETQAELDRDPGPENELLRSREVARVRAALARLPERDATLLLLHHAGFRYREIAVQVGVAATSVGPLLSRAQRRFVEAYRGFEGPAAAGDPGV
jgi:RNA polymerase sigma-70 factor (ECF subfamily)